MSFDSISVMLEQQSDLKFNFVFKKVMDQFSKGRRNVVKIELKLVTAISRSFPNVCPGTSFCRFPGNPSRPVVPLKFSKRDKLLTFMDKINLNIDSMC